jgi:phenylalanyl-tRNA synthetase beta chain
MQISLKWVQELLNLKKVNLDYLLEKLTLGGFEVEKAIEIELDTEKVLILDISATTNRSDSLSIKGISKEIATLLNKPYKNSPYFDREINWQAQFGDLICTSQSKKNYLSFLAITLEQLTNFNSPKWLKQKLIQSGLEPVNNFLDFQNYILLESGYPFEVYDLNKIFLKLKTEKFNLSLVQANTNEQFLTSSNSVHNLNKSILTLKANQLNLSLPGITPNKAFAYSGESTSLLIEAAIFDPTFIRQQSRSLGLRTDRSARYEKSIKSNDFLSAIYKLITLLKVKNPNLICKIHTKGQILEEESNIINLNYITVNEILGPIKGSNTNELRYINPLLISKYLDQLKFAYIFKSTEFSWQVKIPNLRVDDINRPIDLIEEIGRLHGFNKFLTRLPLTKIAGTEDKSYKLRKKLTMCLLNNGFNELIHYSLTNDNMFLKRPVELINPLLIDCSNLRSSLLPNIIRTVQENLKQGNSYTDGFEYGHIFGNYTDIIHKFEEHEYIGGIFGANKAKSSWSDVPKPLSWFEAKGKIEQIFKQFNCLNYWESYSGELYRNILHPYRSAQINFIANQKLGVFGQINPILAKNLNISADLYLFEFNFGLLKDSFKENKLSLYNEYSLYPKIVKNLSFVVNCQVTFIEIQKILIKNGTKFLTKILLLDKYQGSSISENETSLCLELTFQSKEKTLETKEVEDIIEKLSLLLSTNFNAKIRV